jgi:Tfp pilus assembly protein PilX
MKSLLKTLRNSKGVVMVVALLILLAVTAVGISMIASSALSSTIGKNYRAKIQSFYAADGQMTVLSQQVIDTCYTQWLSTTNLDTLYPRTSFTLTSCPTQNGNVPTNANDGNVNTFWENANAEPKDTAWLRADCGSALNVSKVKIDWDTMWTAKSYSIQGSNDNVSWTTLGSLLNNTNGQKHRIDSLPNLTGSYRYILMRGILRNGSLGHG